MASLTLKNIPDELYARLKRSAAGHKRSINSEVLVCLEKVLQPRRVDPDSLLARARAIRGRLGNVYLTDRDLREAKNSGRP